MMWTGIIRPFRLMRRSMVLFSMPIFLAMTLPRMVPAAFALFGAFFALASPALAAAPEAPVTLTPAKAITATTATLEGTLNPGASATSGWFFAYSTEPLCAGAATTPLEPEATGEALLEKAEVTGLQPFKTYTFCMFATNEVPEQTQSLNEVTFKTLGAAPAVDAESASTVTATAATLEAQINPNNQETSFAFEYSTEATGEALKGTIVTVNGAASLPAVFGDQPVSAPTEPLLPEKTYFYRAVATNAAGKTTGAAGPLASITTAAKPAVSDEHATNVSGEGAVLGGEVNPGGAETSYHFEYDTSEYTSNTPHGTSTTPTPLPGDTSQHPASAPVQGLSAATLYHYRLVAVNGAGTVYGPDMSFTTQSTGGPIALPDHRQYEMVSPPQKHGGEVFGILGVNGLTIGGSAAVQASAAGSRISYLASAPAGNEPAGNRSTSSQLLSSRETNTEGKQEWGTTDLSPAGGVTIPGNGRLETGEPYKLFSADLSRGLLQEPEEGSPVIVREHPGATRTLAAGALPQPVTFMAATPDFTHLLIAAGPLSSGSVYEYSAAGEQFAPVNILENKEPATPSYLGGRDEHGHQSEFAGRHAVSDDGSRVVWGTESQLFTRDMVTNETVQVDAGPEGNGGGLFQLASSDGTRVFFTDGTPLTAGASGNSLYEFDVLSGHLTDLGPVGWHHPANPGGRPRLGDEVLGANEAGTVVYVGSEKVLTAAPNAAEEKAVEGEEQGNIFVLRESPAGSGSWSTSFIATLSTSDEIGYNTEPANVNPAHLAHLPVRVSPDGGFFAFMSDRSLTGYDNVDANSHEPDEEVFLYHAGTEGLVCASCNPTGARPIGMLDTGAYPGAPMDPTRTWGNPNIGDTPRSQWLAGSIPTWNEDQHVAGGPEAVEAPLYASRVLSDSGRLFFDSRDALVPQDVNGRDDVYEYQPGGSGSCPSGGAGCVGLISSGRGSGDSEFVDASVTGNDVFFITAERLVAADGDGEGDMYDASVCGVAGAHACLPVSAAASPPCDSTDACRVAQALQPGVFGAPPSATFSGAGNLAPKPVVVKKPTAAQLRAKALTKALKACARQPRRKRAACRARAHRRYGPVKAARAGRAGTNGRAGA